MEINEGWVPLLNIDDTLVAGHTVRAVRTGITSPHTTSSDLKGRSAT